ncbi:MAG: phosphonoacetaldehyde hydrolase, partial [Deltaproteobacteria bacterium]|nr:phosphonoacetaldehyde hydrolase [Deltaproteobacteria bacterium]
MTKPFVYLETYRGPVLAVILDWAGTAVDYGCIGPTEVFHRAFAALGVEVDRNEIRPFMGLKKIDHVRAMFALESVAEKWRQTHGALPDEDDIHRVYALLEPMMIEAVTTHALPIPGVAESVDSLRSRGIRIGSSTGYTRPMMEALAPVAAIHGYAPDRWVCSSDVPDGRPCPWMCYQNALALQTYPMAAMIKIGDTIADIHEGRNAGMWSVAVTRTSVELGLTRAETEALPPDELRA